VRKKSSLGLFFFEVLYHPFSPSTTDVSEVAESFLERLQPAFFFDSGHEL